MAKYNMIVNSSFTYNTSSGTGNRTLTTAELFSLINNELYTSTVSLSSSDVLYLDVDLGYRLKIDSILLYADDLTKLSNVNFYFKNLESDSYSIGSKNVSAASYIGTVPNPSAPRFIRCTISGINVSLYEFQILNNDNIIAFGSDGSITDTVVEDTPEGVFGEIQTIEIYNDTDKDIPANAYVCVDYTGQPGDSYIDIAASEEGPFYNIMDGDVIKTLWDKGTHNNTKVSNTGDGAILTLSKTTPYENLEPDYIGILPDVTCTYPRIPFGLRKTTSYDYVNNRIYVAFWPGTVTTGSNVKLWYYDVATNTWVFRGELVHNLWETGNICMCCDGVRVYFLTALGAASSTLRTILSHDPNSTLGNITTFTTFNANNISALYFFMTADFKGNLWIKGHHSYQVPTARSFYRLNTSTLVITPLNTDFFIVDSTINYNLLSYDFIRDRLYVMHTEGSTEAFNNNYWLEMYNVATNVWSKQYFNYGVRIKATSTDMSFCCFNEKLYFQAASYNGLIYRYNLNTDIVDTLPVNITTKAGISNRLFVFTPQDTDDTISVVVLGGNTDSYAVFGYNMPQTLGNAVSNLLHISGTYTSPILALEDANSASYFRVDVSSAIGTTNVSKYKDLQDGIVEVRSSSTPPLPAEKMFWLMQALSYSAHYMATYNCTTSAAASAAMVVAYGNGSPIWYGSAFCRKTGNTLYIATFVSQSVTALAFLVDFSGTIIKTANTAAYYTYGSSSFVVCDTSGGFWSYDSVGLSLKHFNNSFILITSVVVSGLCGLAADTTTDGAWYTSSESKSLVHINSSCVTTVTISLGDPYQVCDAFDNGCWVIDLNDAVDSKTIKKYSSSGELLLTIKTTKTFKVIASDLIGGFYTLSFDHSQELHHYTKEGNQDMVITGLSNDTHLSGGPLGVILYASTISRTRYVSLKNKTIVWTKFYTDYFATSSYMLNMIPVLATFRIEEQGKYPYAQALVPGSYETLWGNTSTSLPWKEVDKDGYFLTKNKYHQVRLTLWNFDGVSTPSVIRVLMAPAVCIPNILPQQSKPLFIRSNIPYGAEINQLDTRIKVWWDVETV